MVIWCMVYRYIVIKTSISFSKKRTYGSIRNILVVIIVKAKSQMSVVNETSRILLSKNKRLDENGHNM